MVRVPPRAPIQSVMFAQPVAGVQGVGVAAGAGVAEVEGESVAAVVHGEGDPCVGSGVFGDVLQAFQAAELHG